MLKTIKILCWSILAIFLIALGVLLSTVKLLKPDRITPIVEQIANNLLNADVSVAKVELKMHHSWPFLNLEVDSLVIVSRDMKNLPAEARDTIPAWADTLATIEQFHGGISLPNLIAGRIDLNNLEIKHPKVNIFLVNEKINNFSIVKPTEEEDTTPTKVPDIRIRSFKIIPDPHSPLSMLRYADAATGVNVEASLTNATLDSEQKDADAVPHYLIDLKSNISTPLLDKIGLLTVPVGLDGTIYWQHDYPLKISLSDFSFFLNKLTGTFATTLDFSDLLTVETFDMSIHPISIADMLNALPISTKAEYGIPSTVETDAAIALDIKLTRPYIAGETMLPHAFATLTIPECKVRWDKIDLRKFALSATATINGIDLDAATIDVHNLLLAGPATVLDLHGRLSHPVSDPYFSGDINGKVIIDRLPPIIMKHINGMMKGTITFNTAFEGALSMFSRDGFHRFKVEGDVYADDFYYLASDTLTMVYAQKAKAKFGTHQKLLIKMPVKSTLGDASTTHVLDSLLTASVTVDSAQILASGLAMRVNDFKIGIGSLQSKPSSDTTAIIPVGGKIHVGMFSLFTLSDTAGIKVRTLDGALSMHRYKGNTHLPAFRLNCAIKRMSAGDNSTRFMVSGSKLNVTMNKLPDSERTKTWHEVKHISDSIRRARPDIPVDSVYRLALAIRERNSTHQHRVHPAFTKADNEIIEWGTTRAFARLLLDWDLKGMLSADRAGLFSTSFPIRNRVDHLNITFNNDSISLNKIQYKAGHSDFLISGRISNMKQAFTSPDKTQSLKINFDMISDTIDVNEISKAFFTGSAAKSKKLNGDFDDEKAMEIAVSHESLSDSIGPFLIPTNIDAQFKLRANNVLYSDMTLHNLTGSILAYDGALNLHELKASSSVGAIDISALYAAPKPSDMKFGFGMQLDNFNIRHFLNLVPAIDSLMPLMRDIEGIINAKIAATADIDRHMNLVIPSLHAAISLSGDSLVLLDKQTYKKISKWLLFKHKDDNMIKQMSVEMVVEDDVLQLFPFVFDFDRYRIGVQGHNDLNMNLDYHIAVLKSPIPFKFGINIKGTPENMRIRLGKAHFNENETAAKVTIADTTRVNLINQFQNVFRRGVRNAQFAKVIIGTKPTAVDIDLNSDTITAADSLYFIQAGMIPAENKPINALAN